MRKIEDVILKNGKSLKEILELHKKWLEDESGKKADLSYENLSDVDLSNSDLRYVILKNANLKYANLIGVDLRCANLTVANLTDADLEGAKLEGANLIGANLSYAKLRSIDLSNADLRGANLRGTDLTVANLKGADLEGANLTDTDLIGANLTRVDLRGANLTDAYLIGANLTEAKLAGADLTGVKYNNITTSFALQCPERGNFIGYKKANDKIVELLITEDAKRSSATTRKCRCSKAKVLSITSLDGKENFEKVNSNYDPDFVYEVGNIIEVKDFDENRWNECSNGIHFFITRDEAVMYQKF